MRNVALSDGCSMFCGRVLCIGASSAVLRQQSCGLRWLLVSEQTLVFVMRPDPEPQIAIGYFHSQRSAAASKAGPPEATSFLKPKGAVVGILFPEAVGFPRGDPGFGR
jgi:hypothetical protein